MGSVDKAETPWPEGACPMPPMSTLSRILLVVLVISAVVQILMYATR
jgi:hypothetical protein